MTFPDSSKKAPNVFFKTYDSTGFPQSKPATPSPTAIISSPPPSPPVPPPIADFSATPLFGDVTTIFNFTDLSLNSPTTWAWDFEHDGIVDSTLQNPSWEYTTPGLYSVTLTVSNIHGSSSITKVAYIEVTPVSEFFTTVLFPILTEDTMSITIPEIIDSDLWYIPESIMSVGVPVLQSGELAPTIVYKTYNEPLAIEFATIGVPVLQSGELAPTIVYKTYNEPLAIEFATIGVPVLQSGELPVVISYINYNEPLTIEFATIGVPTIISGTLI